MEDIEQEIKKAYKSYERVKETDSCHDTWLAQVIEAQVGAKACSKSSIWKKVCKTKQIRTTAKQVKCALGKDQKGQGLAAVMTRHQVLNTVQEHASKISL